MEITPVHAPAATHTLAVLVRRASVKTPADNDGVAIILLLILPSPVHSMEPLGLVLRAPHRASGWSSSPTGACRMNNGAADAGCRYGQTSGTKTTTYRRPGFPEELLVHRPPLSFASPSGSIGLHNGKGAKRCCLSWVRGACCVQRACRPFARHSFQILNLTGESSTAFITSCFVFVLPLFKLR